MLTLVQQLINGLTLGCLFGLVAIGYTMVYGILLLINFAHCDIFMMSMYFAFYSMSLFYLPWYLSLLLAIAGTALLGVCLERVAYRPLRTAPRTSVLISAVGSSYLLENLGIVLFGAVAKSFPTVEYLQEIVTIAGLRVQRLVFFVIIAMVVLVGALLYIVNKTKVGIAMRAVSRDFETSKLMGVNINLTISITFAIGSGLAAVGGFMWGLRYPQITPLVGAMPGLKCFIAAVIGGIGSIKGAIVGGLILGVMEIMIVYLFPGASGYRDVFAFIALILILCIKPTGLFGEELSDKA
ncbi:MAG: branched-chain amino acid ABC transporter permease [Oscillibacter sp.]|nr:branched-chain amino acid ABC transporter permease [Oscillibacter sp.]